MGFVAFIVIVIIAIVLIINYKKRSDEQTRVERMANFSELCKAVQKYFDERGMQYESEFAEGKIVLNKEFWQKLQGLQSLAWKIVCIFVEMTF